LERLARIFMNRDLKRVLAVRVLRLMEDPNPMSRLQIAVIAMLTDTGWAPHFRLLMQQAFAPLSNHVSPAIPAARSESIFIRAVQQTWAIQEEIIFMDGERCFCPVLNR